MPSRHALLTLPLLALFALFALPPTLAGQVVHHEIEATIEPTTSRIEIRDRVTLGDDKTQWHFLLHEDLRPEVPEGSGDLRQTGHDRHLVRWQLDRTGAQPVTLRYSGTIRHDLAAIRQSMGRTRHWSPGIVAADGVFLGGQSGWYPITVGGEDDGLITFALEVSLPTGWLAVSQGVGPDIRARADGVTVAWRESHPQDQIHLVAAPFERYRRASAIAEAQVYLRKPDATLADRYLDATVEYLALYDELIGRYPYAKFALVENFWETGYGMPSFTLLGPRVIRLPFILRTSYPHEILHNWWGNGVYVDYDSGNWSEGLTAYLADHLLRERQGQGAEYRRDTLQSYEDYVDSQRDFPIRAFQGRHGAATQAIGYGKTMMVFHMLRRELGDAAFIEGLQRFYDENRFRKAGFGDLRAAFESVSDRDLEDFFRHWTERPGAPELRVTAVEVSEDAQGLRVGGMLHQAQPEPPFPLTVPLLIHTGEERLAWAKVSMSERRTRFDIAVPDRPIRLAVDPSFDLFRHLVTGEAPITLSRLFGTEQGLIIVPAGAPPPIADAYRELARSWSQGQRGWSVADDASLAALPRARAVWLLGWENRFLSALASSAPALQIDVERRRVALAEGREARAQEGVVATAERGDHAVGWLAAADPSAVRALARKVPHYGKYSYLVFAQDTNENRIKGQWPIAESALTVWLTEDRPELSAPPRAPLAPE